MKVHIRVVLLSMIEHGLILLVTAINMTTSRRRDDDGDTMEVVVDGDEGAAYGSSQYTDTDVCNALKSPERASPSRDADVNHSKENKW